ncbi:ribonuclease Y [Salinispora tropica]|uniref:Ribonuclease Y n=1 Tax=Salinispora tropica (strain ATCC BAA-916 / DSM 44818 / JCM 13857 / NBRC 105044 / CNB-440) TaxID=369723 RepID=RNY_SALTO|nr:ribonuclease Y [Salinispora tropica]A4X4U3.1 RecName: Full=Ribonuclease Y; Short=RNase Y [Salinispora tropica CNB-440]ABP53893.1 metal dependent phophohydrolase [Salinispora tropica CNB-440]
MNGFDAVLLVAVLLLTVVVVGAVLVGVRAVRGLAGTSRPDDPAFIAEKDRQEQSLAALRSAAEEANSTIDAAKSAAAAARTEAAAARAEAKAARAEARRVLDGARAEAEAILERVHKQAETEAEQLRTAARRSGEREAAVLAVTTRDQAAEVERRAVRMDDRERLHTEEVERLAERDRQLSAANAALEARESALAERDRELEQAEQRRRRELERVAGLTAEAARGELVEAIEAQAKREAALRVRDIEAEARSTGEERARHIVVDAIQRVASEQTAESVVSVLHLPGDEMKGRIIGREGRNIRTFESITGVNLIIDDTPEAVLLSCFDPVRREVGRLTLEKLVLDGRIHPHRIEEVHDLARQEVAQLCQRAAEDALVEVGITEIHPELVGLLGRLRYRTSYGQNVLKHLVESAHIAGIMAAELRLDVPTIKRCAFLHDIGKALTHEVEGSHAIVGADVARRYGESEDVVHAIEAHHNEVPPQTVEAVLTQASDACSGGRPGARRESLEAYVRRLERIEEIAGGKLGVERVFAMQAGREVRVMVRPDDVDDLSASMLARDVAKQIEEELTYPGQIRVTVVRESRVTEIAR